MTETCPLLLVGTYTQDIFYGALAEYIGIKGEIAHGKGRGILCFLMNPLTGELTQCGETGGEGTQNVSFFAFDKPRNRLYAVNELETYGGNATGAVSAFSFDAATRTLKLLNIRETGGTNPCYIIVNDAGTHILTTNYMSGSVCVFPIEHDGSLGEMSDFIQHEGSSVDETRQAGPHCHAIVLDRTNRHAIVTDLGLDRLLVYKTDFVSGTLSVNEESPRYAVEPGQGPRHCVFNAAGDRLYLLNEIGGTVMVFAYEEATGFLERLQCVSSIAKKQKGKNLASDIHIAPGGRFLYVSNRGCNSVALYRIDPRTGLLEYVDTQSSHGLPPRNFVIDPSGHFLLVCNHETDNIVTFGIDGGTGKLSKVCETKVLSPVYPDWACVGVGTVDGR